MFKKWRWLQKSGNLARFEQWLWGCWCFGPCSHKHSRAHEWFWNTRNLYPFTLWVYHDVFGIDRPEL